MKLQVVQSSIGRYNLMGNEETFEFSMVIKDKEGQVVADGENKARIRFSGEPDEKDAFDDIEDISYIFSRCWEYSKRIISSTDYQGDALLFAKTLKANFYEINALYEYEQKEKLERQIVRLQEKLASNLGISFDEKEIEAPIQKEVVLYERWINESEKELLDLIPGSEGANKVQTKIDGYRTKIAKLSSAL